MKTLVCKNAVIFDGLGNKTTEKQTVVIEDGIITGIGESCSLPKTARVVDLDGHFLLPGFIDAHVHLTKSGGVINPAEEIHEPGSLSKYHAAANLQKTINAGVTYARDLSGADYGAVMAVEQGLVVGPRLVVSVQAIGPTGGHSDHLTLGGYDSDNYVPGASINPVADGPVEAKKRTRELLRAGAGVIKIMGTGGVWSPRDDPKHDGFSIEETEAVVKEASNKGVYVAAHAQGTNGIKNALHAGVMSIEHGYLIDDEGINLMLKNDAWLVPTLLTGTTPPDINKAPGYAYKKKSALQTELRDHVATAIARGTKVAMGTDSGVVPHGQNLRELSLMVECGMTPMAAICAGTSIAAELLGISSKVGSVAIGKEADLVVTDKDPIDNISALGEPDNIKLVIQSGNIVVDRMNLKTERNENQ